MTDSTIKLLSVMAIAAPLASGIALQAVRAERVTHAVNRVMACIVAAIGIVVGVQLALFPPKHHVAWMTADTAAGVFVVVISIVAVASALLSPAYLTRTGGRFFAQERSVRLYYFALYAFWSALIAVPLCPNLGVVWLVVEATTAASAVLVAFTGKSRALEAGWKYLILTTLGLSLSFLGIVLMFVASRDQTSSLAHLNWTNLTATLAHMPHSAAVSAYTLVIVGLASKIGWAPVHNWLPDAHSEAPAPISAMLSAALLPTVLLVAWRLRDAASTAIGITAATAPIAVFGLLSVAVAVPFLWQPLAWKRLLAYSSLEHMGIIALGVAFGSPLALAGVVIHVAGHALAKALGFYAAIPLYEALPNSSHHTARAVAASSPRTFAAMSVSAYTLAGLPPGPLFFSELFIILGGIQSGHTMLALTLAILLALAFGGLLHALLEALQGNPPHSPPTAHVIGSTNTKREAPILIPTALTVAGLCALTLGAYVLPGSAIVHQLIRGIA